MDKEKEITENKKTTKKSSTKNNATKKTTNGKKTTKKTTNTKPKTNAATKTKTTTKSTSKPKSTTPLKKEEELKDLNTVVEIKEEIKTSVEEVTPAIEEKEEILEERKTKEKKETINEIMGIEKIIMLVASVLIIILLIFRLIQIQEDRNEKELQSSYLVTNNIVTNVITDINQEIDKDEYFIVINYTGNETTLNFEKEIKTVLDKNNIREKFYYYDATEIKETDDYLTILADALGIKDLNKIPAVIYFRNKEYFDQVKRDDDQMIQGADLQKLIDIYEIK